MVKIVIDPGHGGKDSGATGNGLVEKELCLELSFKLLDKLKKYDCELELTREKDEYVSFSDRGNVANEINTDFFYSVHINGHNNKDAHGYETFIHSSNPSYTRKIAEKIHVPLANYWLKNGSADRGLKTANFQVLRETSMPAILVENGFLTNRKDAELLKNEEFKNGLVEAMEKGIVEALGLEKLEGNDYLIDERIKKAIKYFEKKELINSPNYWYKTVEENEPIGWLLVLLQNAIEQ